MIRYYDVDKSISARLGHNRKEYPLDAISRSSDECVGCECVRIMLPYPHPHPQLLIYVYLQELQRALDLFSFLIPTIYVLFML